MKKSPEAFRTISEVADWLDTHTHVLRFWESRFSQIKPVKRAGGRRYYRPTDMQLLGGIKVLLHERGMTIRGAQKLLREEGVKSVAALSPPLDIGEDDQSIRDVTPAKEDAGQDVPEARIHFDAEPEPLDNVVQLERPEHAEEPASEVEPAEEPVSGVEPASIAAEQIPDDPDEDTAGADALPEITMVARALRNATMSRHESHGESVRERFRPIYERLMSLRERMMNAE